MRIEETAYIIETLVKSGQHTYRRTHVRCVDRRGETTRIQWHIDRFGRWCHVDRESREALEQAFLRLANHEPKTGEVSPEHTT